MECELVVKIWGDGRKHWQDDLPASFASHIEHIQTLLEDGYVAGEICDERFSGWWNIKTA